MNFPGKVPSILLLVLLAAQGKRPSVASAHGLWSRVKSGWELLKLLTLNYSTGSSAHWEITKTTRSRRIKTSGLVVWVQILNQNSDRGWQLSPSSWARLSDSRADVHVNFRLLSKHRQCSNGHPMLCWCRKAALTLLWRSWCVRVEFPWAPGGRVRQQQMHGWHAAACSSCVEGCGHPQRWEVSTDALLRFLFCPPGTHLSTWCTWKASLLKEDLAERQSETCKLSGKLSFPLWLDRVLVLWH